MIEYLNAHADHEGMPDPLMAMVAINVIRTPDGSPVPMLVPNIVVRPDHPENFDKVDLTTALSMALGEVLYARGVDEGKQQELETAFNEVAANMRIGYHVAKIGDEQ
nr:MAG TPA: hypothetical protein [Caudoviricetes sp.]